MYFDFFCQNVADDSVVIKKFFKNSDGKSRGLQKKCIQIDFLWNSAEFGEEQQTFCKYVYLVAMAKQLCAMVMTKIECYLPAIYRLNQEVFREETQIDTLYYENQNNQSSYPLSVD